MVSKLLTSKSEAGVVEEDMLSVIKNVAGMAFLGVLSPFVNTPQVLHISSSRLRYS